MDDDSIINDGQYVRDSINYNEKLLQSLFDTLENANFSVNQEAPIREYTLNILYRVFQTNRDLAVRIQISIVDHIKKIKEALKTLPEREESLRSEMKIAEGVLVAPHMPINKNFPDVKPEPSHIRVKKPESAIKAEASKLNTSKDFFAAAPRAKPEMNEEKLT